ncbi:ElyC/SanA/YdcF family protein [Neobacillus dielmonensis]|uniref:ElyC/SanA/YdcF family protein n=1 Tax=Neobacillus dielmonensis TaxID=1347369 RepID=UPI0005AAF49F|nr:ElyC/SanA/YdcF family protein [Neobacillus dielmonensis]
MDLSKTAENLNRLSDFLGKRDIQALTSQALQEKYGVSQVDLLILFGGSIPYGFDVVGQALTTGIAKTFMVVGGEGHTTESMRQAVHQAYPDIVTEGKMEADIISEYIRRNYQIADILIERNSTNCGNNVTYALEVMKQHQLRPRSILIVQDTTMQHRMDATFRKFLSSTEVELINFASYKVRVQVREGELVIEPSDLWGMWDLNRFISLLMGEIPRLLDNTDGYGPSGKNYIASVDVPPEVLAAFEELKVEFGDRVRVANPLYASKK